MLARQRRARSRARRGRPGRARSSSRRATGSVSGAVAYAWRKRRPRAASALNAGVSTPRASGPTASARVVSSVTSRIDGARGRRCPSRAAATHASATSSRPQERRARGDPAGPGATLPSKRPPYATSRAKRLSNGADPVQSARMSAPWLLRAAAASRPARWRSRPLYAPRAASRCASEPDGVAWRALVRGARVGRVAGPRPSCCRASRAITRFRSSSTRPRRRAGTGCDRCRRRRVGARRGSRPAASRRGSRGAGRAGRCSTCGRSDAPCGSGRSRSAPIDALGRLLPALFVPPLVLFALRWRAAIRAPRSRGGARVGGVPAARRDARARRADALRASGLVRRYRPGRRWERRPRSAARTPARFLRDCALVAAFVGGAWVRVASCRPRARGTPSTGRPGRARADHAAWRASTATRTRCPPGTSSRSCGATEPLWLDPLPRPRLRGRLPAAGDGAVALVVARGRRPAPGLDHGEARERRGQAARGAGRRGRRRPSPARAVPRHAAARAATLAALYWALPVSWLSSGVLGFLDGALAPSGRGRLRRRRTRPAGGGRHRAGAGRR